MYITARTLDDLLHKVYRRLLTGGIRIKSTKGSSSEISGVLLKLDNPRARLSRTETRGILFSGLGELLWYLNGTNRLEFIEHYIPAYSKLSDDKETIYGGYGPRLFGSGEEAQIARVIEVLRAKPTSRQAVVQIFDRRDLLDQHLDTPCTCTLQFMVRDRRLNMLTSMRSNDAYMGLPHDIFAFTMLQELIAKSVNVGLGEYKHFVGSLHLYDCNRDKAVEYLSEGLQTQVSMPPMPDGDPWKDIASLLVIEQELRRENKRDKSIEALHPYWEDLGRILEIFALTKITGQHNRIRSLTAKMASSVYSPYIKRRANRVPPVTDQLEIFEDARAFSGPASRKQSEG